MRFSSNIAQLRPSATIAVSTLAKRLKAEGRDIIDLSAGEPDFDTPDWISEAGIEAIRAGRTRYTPTPGIPELRQAIARYHEDEAGRPLDAEGVVVGAGAKQPLFNACFCLFGPGDEVLVATPYWTSYPEMITLARATPVFVSGDESRDHKLTPEDLERVRTPNTKGLLFSSPSNPSGAVYTAEELRAVAEWARDHDVVLLSDEIYQRIYFGPGGRAPGVLSLPPDSLGPYVLFNGASKAVAMTGWRIGYSYSEPDLARKMTALQSHTTSNPAAPSQYATLAAYQDPQRMNAAVAEMLGAFRRRRDLVTTRVQEKLPGVSYVRPDGAFYLYFRVDGAFGESLSSAADVCTRVLEEVGVALVPGEAFGDARYARMSFATSDALLEEAIDRMARVLGAQGAGVR
ncbi:MAG: pyridoxal phosphate-dependent aminotransferase [Gemmatimonadota bacterium]